ncbi:MAG: serine--tRNA ligase [Candidatus Bilamarchaeaceae archaeon]
MIDIELIRENIDVVIKSLNDRNQVNLVPVVNEIKSLDDEWRIKKKEEDKFRTLRNQLSNKINEKKKKKEDCSSEIAEAAEIAKKIDNIKIETEALLKKRDFLLLTIPAIPHSSVPVGKDEKDNVEVRRWGTPQKKAEDVLSHYEIGLKTDLIDYERGVKLAEHRFSVLKGDLAKLERALINFMLSVQITHGYKEYALPYLVNTKTMTGTGQLPKFAEELYKCKDDDLWLIPTAEVPLTNLYAGEIIEEKNLPLKLTAFTPCFRREAGAYGKDIHGLIRQHQFDKVELVKIAHPENSYDELETLTLDAERILQLLDLPYRTVLLCTGDMGFASTKTYDIEVWLPSENRYREISSCSNCGDFQARRANIKYRGKDGKLHYVHTLNGSGLAVGRTLLAILENYQEDKSIIKIPKVLQDFMGKEEISLF